MSKIHVSTAGESHGPAETCIVTGIPAGLELSIDYIDAELARRRKGYGRGGRMSIESDTPQFLAGVRLGRTLGSPICIQVPNKDHESWLDVMSPDPRSEPAPEPVTMPRPGHADLSGLAKYGSRDIRDILERASARETVARVAAGAICKRLLAEVGVEVRGRVVEIGGVASVLGDGRDLHAVDWAAVERSLVACADSDAAEKMCTAIDEAGERGESLGGVFEIWCWQPCPGVGGYATPEERLDGRLIGALASIPAIKGVEIGLGFEGAKVPGSQAHDAMYWDDVGSSGDAGGRVVRHTNRAGGIEGGMTTGMPLILRAAMKPIPTLKAALPSVDLVAKVQARAHVERSDICAVPAARVVGEAMVATVVASAYLEKFGGDGLDHFKAAVQSYECELAERGIWHRSS